MSAPAELPLAVFAIASLGLFGAIWLSSNKKPTEEKFVASKKMMIHNSLKTPIRAIGIGTISPGDHIFISNPNAIFNSEWLVRGKPFLKLGPRGTRPLEEAIKMGKLYLGGIDGVYVYIDQVELSCPADGPKELVIANLSQQYLTLSGIPPVPPTSQITYRGSQGNGLDLGSKFIDTKGNFHSYTMNQPITRLVFGMVGPTPPPEYQINFSVIGMEVGETVNLMKPGGILV